MRKMMLMAAMGGVGLMLGGKAMAGDTEITVDRARPGATISPYVYGQFIEHLGRCIHDGIWAEKLRDRKFLLEPGKAWEVVKPAGAEFEARHEKEEAYAGDHSFALWLRDAKGGRCGVRQGGLGLIAGKDYVGYAILAHAGEVAPVDMRLAWGADAGAGQTVTLGKVGSRYRKFPFRFRAGATTDDASLSLTLTQPAHLRVACLSLMPAENTKGMRSDTLALIRNLAPPITRWPGGNFVSGYNWKDAIGDRDRRPPRWERAWNDVEDNDFGLDEFMTFCAEVHTEPYITVNSGLGSAADAADEVEYCRGSTRTWWGAERARNGHRAPYRVEWWGIGNEMYGSWQLGHVPIEHYAVRHNAFVEAMRGRDPHIKVIAVGAPGAWNDAMLAACVTNMDLLSGHHYSERKYRLPFSADDAHKYEEQFRVYSGAVAGGVRGLVNDFRKRQQQGNAQVDRVRLAVDEWGIVRDWNPSPDAGGVGAFEHYYCLGDAIATARALHELLRAADVVAMANWAQTVNVIGAIKTSRNYAALDPAGHVMALYRAHLAGQLVPVSVSGDVPLDACATWNAETKMLAVGLINYSPAQEVAVALHVTGKGRAATARAWRIHGPKLEATNIPGQPEAVTTTGLSAPVPLEKPITLPAHSITMLEIRSKP